VPVASEVGERMSKREKILLRVDKGALVPVDGLAQQRLRERGYNIGDVLSADLTKPRNPRFHRLVHAFGHMLVENLEEFDGLDAHAVLKRLQIEGGIACDEIPLKIPGVGAVHYRVPRSLSYASMDDGEFHEVFSAMCKYTAKRYWPEMTPAQIDEMAQMMAREAA
jgi:hypothetical protein